MSSWFSIKAKSETEAEVMIYDEIGFYGTTAKQFAADLAGIKAKTINLRLNTPGGDVFDGLAIYNALKSHPAEIVVHIDGLAASMGSVIALAGDKIRIAKNAYMMIHNPWTMAAGDASDLRKTADTMDKLADTLADTYAAKTGKTPKEMREAMQEETWMNAKESLAFGLVDEIADEDGDLPAAVAVTVTKFAKAPEALRRIAAMYIDKNGQRDKPASEGAGATVANPLENTMNLEQFKAFAAEHPEAAAPFIEQGKRAGATDARATEMARAKAVRDACGGNDSLALDLFIAGKEAEDAALTVATVAKAKADVEATIQAQAKEIEKLRAQVGTQAAIGGTSAVVETSATATLDPKVQAEQEWDTTPAIHANWISRDIFVKARVRELSK